MSNFAQIITSFERTGNFPFEANYIFPSVEELRQFYSDPIQAATLHKGLLKVVESDDEGNQALYWVTKKTASNELEFTKLVAGKDIQEITAKLAELQTQLETETTERNTANTAIWGTNDPSDIDEDYNSINDLANQAKALKTVLGKLQENSFSGDKSLKNQIKAVVGTTENDIIAYLDTLPYSSVTELAAELNRIVNAPEGTNQTNAIDTLKELSIFLEGYTNKDTLEKILEKLWHTVEGEVLPSKPFRTLRGIEDYLIEQKTVNDYKQGVLIEEMSNMEAAVGLNADGRYTPDPSTNYLQEATSIVGALRILDRLLHKYISANVPRVRNEDEAIKMTLTQELDSYVLAAALKLSTQAGNQLTKNSDGLYACAKTYYDKGVLTFKVNDNIISQHYIGMSAIVQSAVYDRDNEQLVFVFKLNSGETQTVQVPVGALIREWEVENKDTSPIVLNRTTNISGTDNLSADIRLSTLPFNILVKDNNTLYVKGATDSIYHEGLLLSNYLTTFQQSVDNSLDKIRETLETARVNRESIKQALDNGLQTSADERTRLNAELAKLSTAVTAANEATRTETQRAVQEEAKLQQAINGEAERAKQVESALSQVIQTVSGKLDTETARATRIDQELANRIDNLEYPEYSITKQSTPEPGCIATYILTKDGTQVGNKIDVPEVPVKISATYNEGVLTIIVNGSTIGSFNIGLNSPVKDSRFETENKTLVQEFNLHNGNTQVVRTPLSEFAEYILNRVEGKLDSINNKINDKADEDSPIIYGVPHLDETPEDNDSSQRIASTAWVQKHIAKILDKISASVAPEWINVDDTPTNESGHVS